MEAQCGVTKNNDTLMGHLQVLQNKTAKVLLNLPPRNSSTEALDRLDLKTLLKRRHFHRCVIMHKYLSGEIDFQFDVRRNNSFHSYLTRRSNDLRVVQYSQIDSIGVSGDKKGLHWYQWYDWYQ